jgi:hypothetical protein
MKFPFPPRLRIGVAHMADEKGKEGADSAKRPLQEDRILARMASGPGQAPAGLTSYVGLLGRSPNAGHWRLFLSLDMSVYVEIREEDIVESEQLSKDQSPFGGLGGTRVFVKKGADVTTTQTVSLTHKAGADDDEFDLDIRLGAQASSVRPLLPKTGIGGGPAGTCDTCHTQCDTCPGDTCKTCQTDCNQATCKNTCNTHCGTCNTCTPTNCATCLTCDTNCGTCNTMCGQATCGTCQTQCNQATCHTCQTQCNQATCNTCKTQCDQGTCDTCHVCTSFKVCRDTSPKLLC